MSISARVREQLINSFREELKEHIQTMTDGLLALEQNMIADEDRRAVLDKIFRAAHSLKGAARSVGVTMIEQLAHALEDLLDALRHGTLEPTPEFFTTSYKALDAIQEVQAAYEAGKVTPPSSALQVLSQLESVHPEAEASQTEEAEPVANAEAADASDETSTEISAEASDVTSAADAEVSTEPQSPELPPPTQEKAPADPTSLTPEVTASVTSALASTPDETIRVNVSKLDALMAQLSELLVTKIRAEQRLAQLREVEERMATWQKDWLAVRSAYSRQLRHRETSELESVDSILNGTIRERAPETEGATGAMSRDQVLLLDYLGEDQEQLHETSTMVSDLVREYANDTMHMSLVIDELEDEIKRVRMLPLTTITAPFGRMVRDLAHAEGKEAMLRIIGGETELDKRVLEQIKDPLIHLLRNAVDHGIESPEERGAKGKYRIGTITLTAQQMGNDVVISISDDGAGLDLEAIRNAIARQRDTALAETLNDSELVEYLFSGGISTSPVVTDISGRGLGLDIVRRSVEALHGIIDVDWKPEAAGEGTTFTLRLPLTLSSSRGLLVWVSEERFAIPLNAIEYIMSVDTQAVIKLGGDDTIRYNGHPVPLIHLSDVLGLPRTYHSGERGDEVLVVILAAVERRMAFVVDDLATEQEIVIKSLGKQLQRVKGVAGATVMGSGEIVLILNVADLIKMALRGQQRAIFGPGGAGEAPSAKPKASRAQRQVLVVDDSITTRTLEKNILEAAGFKVQLATDGQEAWDVIAAGGLPDLVVSDVAMPRLDGIELTSRLKSDPRTSSLPVILVTSLDSPQDKARGIDAGADAYITKGSFDQSNLLETIEQLI
jgi:two-component system chemotaxis sensor kinase CheA